MVYNYATTGDPAYLTPITDALGEEVTKELERWKEGGLEQRAEQMGEYTAKVAIAVAGTKGMGALAKALGTIERVPKLKPLNVTEAVEEAKNTGNSPLVKELKDAEGMGEHDFITDPVKMKKHIIVPEDGFQAFLERKYIEIRKSGIEDIGTVAKNTGLTEEQILKMKKHLFLDTKQLSVDGKPYEELYFQADPEIAYAWQKAQKGELTNKEKEWFNKLADHEIKEKEYMDGGMPLRDQSTWNQNKKRFDPDPSKNAHDKADTTDPNPTDPFPGYDSGSDYIKHMDDDIDY